MNFLFTIKTSAVRTLKSLQGVVIIWFISLLLVSMIVLPLKGTLISGLGTSMITEKLSDGLNIDVFADLGSTLKNLSFSFSRGVCILILTGFILNTFLTGGLFDSLKGSSGKFSAGEFFRASAKNFWSFLIISLVLCFIVLFLAVLIIAVPVDIVNQAAPTSDGVVLTTGIVAIPVFLLASAIILLIADYARAWQVSEERNSGFRALRFGFKQTFRRFLSSYPIMIIVLGVQVLYGWLVLTILPGLKPVTGGGVFLLFLLSQFLFFIKILLKVWRYGTVTSLMEQSFNKVS
jgi:hypothetical protein